MKYLPCCKCENLSYASSEGICLVKKSCALIQSTALFLKTNPNFNTNAPPFEVRGRKVLLGGAFDIFLSDFY